MGFCTGLDFYFGVCPDCGTEDGLIRGARNFIRVLEDNNIPFTFTYAQSKGGHKADYWMREVVFSMAVQYHIIQRQLAKKIT